jgi:hypothetical protein
MYTEHPSIHHRAQRQIIKQIAAIPPDIRRSKLALTLVVEAIDLGDLAGFVVASNQGEAVGVADFKGDEEEEGLDRVEASVDKVALSEDTHTHHVGED